MANTRPIRSTIQGRNEAAGVNSEAGHAMANSAVAMDHVSLQLGVVTAEASVRWAIEEFGDAICLLASMQDAVLIDVALGIDPGLPVVFLDTGYHFPETLQTLRSIEHRYHTNVEVIGPLTPPKNGPIPFGACCENKVELLERALAGRRAWFTGARRGETEHRAALPLVGHDRRGLVKVSPLAQWNDGDVTDYIAVNKIITNPLLAQGYTSIGCAPCTAVSGPGDPRSGRWAGSTKTECGLHL